MAWNWQKTDEQGSSVPEASPEAPPTAAPAPKREKTKMEKIVNIGQSVQIKGELTGNEDLTIEGMVDGKILVKDHNLTIGTNGKITAEVHAKTVVVLGQVIGNITADDKVDIASSGSVEGDIRAPRVSIADGARFKGSIDMERKPGAAAAKSATGSTPSSHISKEMARSASAVEG